jgi:hypothetical protein
MACRSGVTAAIQRQTALGLGAALTVLPSDYIYRVVLYTDTTVPVKHASSILQESETIQRRIGRNLERRGLEGLRKTTNTL